MKILWKTLLLAGMMTAWASPEPTSQPCRCSSATPRADAEFVLQYHPEVWNGPGCVVPRGGRSAPRSIVASHSQAWFQLLQLNRTGQPQKKVKVRGGQPGRLAIYRHVQNQGKPVEELVEVLSAPGDPSFSIMDVEPGGILGFVNFRWPSASQAKAGSYVARLLEPQAGMEVRFDLRPARR